MESWRETTLCKLFLRSESRVELDDITLAQFIRFCTGMRYEALTSTRYPLLTWQTPYSDEQRYQHVCHDIAKL